MGKFKFKIKDVFYFLQGYTREFIYNHCEFLMRKHIKEQFEHRCLEAEACYKNGSCLGCGCTTPALFFANKGCSLRQYPVEIRKRLTGKSYPCYPEMMGKKEWNEFKKRINQNYIKNV